MKENDVQPTNNGRSEDELGQVPEQNPDITRDPAASGENNPQPDVPEQGRLDDNRENMADRDELTPVDDMVSSDPTEPAAAVPPGHNGTNPASAGGGGGKGWMVASLLLAAALIVVLIAPPFAKDTGKEAVATVNNVDITKDKLYAELVKAGGEQTLDGLIREELLNQELGKKSIKITDAQVTEEIDSVKKMFPSEDEFNNALASSGMTMDNLKEQTKMQLEITKLLGDKVKVTDDEIKKTYDQYKDSFATPEQVRASHILVDTKEEAEKIIKQLKDGADFAAIAKEKNEDATKDTGGDLGFFPKGKMDPAFEEAAFKLKKGEISSEPVKSSFGYHVIKVTDRKEATNPTFEDKKEEIRKQLVSSKVSEQSGAYLQELKDKAKITNTLEKKDEKADEKTAETPAKP